ncbi:MAG: V-type ATP synthase subunit E [Spirochaetia bacterium]|nr:V-type ATP synthase subunit E [Spirochaetia bacterium]
MEVKLQELIDSIKKEGVESAEQEADLIIKAADDKADSIISDARKKAARMISEAEKKSEMKEQSSISSIVQASRDLLLSLEKNITSILTMLLQERLEKELKKNDVLADLVKILLTSDLASGNNEIIQLPEESLKSVQNILLADIGEKLRKGYELKPVKNLSSGFRFAEKDGNGYFNVTPEVLADMLGKFLNPELKALLIQAAGEGE